jgi:HAD superfamily hydrolase (TIGR01549 family)
VRPLAVGFDIDHTLLIDNKLERVAMLHLLQGIRDEGGMVFDSLAKETEIVDDLLTRQRSGRCTIEEAIEEFVRSRDISDPAPYVRTFRETALRMVDSFITPDPYARSVIDELRADGIPMAILSNGWNPLQKAKAHRAGFAGPMLVSAEIGTQKPDPIAFHLLAERLGVPPEHCVYVGDTPVDDCAGAIHAGLQSVWLDHEGKIYPPDIPRPTHVVHALRDLPGVIRSAVQS